MSPLVEAGILRDRVETVGRRWSYSLSMTLAVVLAVSLPRVVWLRCCSLPLFGDEAQYWTWSRELALGYYSKPPLIAWLIALTTTIGGDGEFWVRIGAPLLHIGTSLFLYGTGRRLYDARVGFWAAVVYATLPSVFVASLLISTDVPLLFFYSAGLYAAVRALREERRRWWVLVGVCLGLGLLSKYAMGFFAVSLVAARLLERRRWGPASFRGLGWALLIGLLLLVPNLLWNVRHGYLTVVHTTELAQLESGWFHPLKGLEFIAAQVGVFGLFFVVLVAMLIRRWREHTASREDSLLRLFVLPPFLLYVPLAFLRGAYVNWAAASYAGATVLVTAHLLRTGRARWLSRGAVGHYVVVALVVVVPQIAAATGILRTRLDPWYRLRGWDEVGRQLSRLREAYPKAALISDRRLYLAEFFYYVRPYPEDAIQWNLNGRVDGYEMTTDVRRSTAEEFLFVTDDPEPERLLRCWEEAAPVGEIRAPIASDRDRVFQVYRLRGFRGPPPGH